MENKETIKQRKVKQWKEVLTQRSGGLTLAQVGRINDISRQRVYQIIKQAIEYTKRHDDELSRWILSKTVGKK